MASWEKDSRRKEKFISSTFSAFFPAFATKVLAFSFCTWPLQYMHQALLTQDISASLHPSPENSLDLKTVRGGVHSLYAYHTLFFPLITRDKESLLLFYQGGSPATYPLASCTLYSCSYQGLPAWIYPLWIMKSSRFPPLLYDSYKHALITLTCTYSITYKTGKSLNPTTCF